MRRLVPERRALAGLLAATLLLQAPAIRAQAPSSDPPPASRTPTVPTPDVPTDAARTAGDPVSVRALVAEALQANPELAAMRREFDAARARVPQATALPDPMVMVGNMTQKNPVPFAGLTGDFSEVYVGASQAVPWFGVRRLRGQVASAEAEAKLAEYEARGLEIAAEVETIAHELFALDKAIAVVTRDREILDKLAKVAEARYTVGQAEQVDIVNARLELTELLDQEGMLGARRSSAAARLSALLFRDPDAPVGEITAELRLVDLPPFAELVRLAESNAPSLAGRRRTIDRDAHALRLAEREAKYPEVGFSFVYHNRPAFEDYYEYGVTLQVPLWSFRKQRHGVAEKTADLAASRSRLDAAEAGLKARLRDAYARATTAARLVRLAEQGLIPQATLALESALSSYQVGKVDFRTVLEALEKALDYETRYYEQLAEYHKAVAEIEAAAGVELTR